MDSGTLIILGILVIATLILLKNLLKAALFLIAAIVGTYLLAKAGYLPDGLSNAVMNTFSFFDKLNLSSWFDKISALLEKIKDLGGVLG